MAIHLLEAYLRGMYRIRVLGAGTKETSFYPPLGELLAGVGAGLRPKVLVVSQLGNAGAGSPDFGLFTPDQIQRQTEKPQPGAVPARGVVEVKGAGEAVLGVAETEQVSKYWRRYRQVLVTNYREFLLVGQDEHGEPVRLEGYRLAETEARFWQAAARPEETATVQGERFIGYLQRVLLQAAPLAEPKDVAWLLASYARDARIRLEAADMEDLRVLREALEGALGLAFQGEKGEHFFRSTVVQTIFYGLFSAWVLWHREQPGRTDLFSWHGAAQYLNVPVIERLFYQLIEPRQLRKFNLTELLNWTAAALNRVDRGAFFGKFEEQHAVQYFYEPFLEAFDPELRKDLGVWYTPREVVQYMVARVDTVLKEELGVADGLADERVVVLDPCCGTGAYLVEVLRHIGGTLAARGEGGMVGIDLKRAALERVYGFEILTAPFVVAHLQVGLLLKEYGISFAPGKDGGHGERAGVYLTNALTGWVPGEEPQTLLFPELKEERDAADEIKQKRRILVILGNPPYAGYPGIAIGEERDLSDAYRETKRAPKPQGQGLNDLYVRFFRMAERQIADKTGRGIVCFISNYSWLDGLSHTGMRERYLEAFDRVWIDSLNGDKYRTGKTTPDGRPDPSIFSTRYNREGIQVGTAVALLARTEPHAGTDAVFFRNVWGREKAEILTETAHLHGTAEYERVEPSLELGYTFAPRELSEEYLTWPTLPELFPAYFSGVTTARDESVVDMNRDDLVARMMQYFNPSISDDEIMRTAPRLIETTSQFPAKEARKYLQKRGFLRQNVVRYLYRPFDVRWLYWEPETKLIDRNRDDYWPHVFNGNVWFTTTTRYRKQDFYTPQISSRIVDYNVVEANVKAFPLYLAGNAQPTDLFGPAHHANGQPRPNLSERARAYLDGLYPVGTDAPAPPHELLFYHALAVLHAPRYRAENAGALRQDWPRVPLPEDRAALERSATLGRRVAALLDVEQDVPGVTSGEIREELRAIGVPERVGGGSLDPSEGHFDVSARWGYAGKGGVTMPGPGRTVVRDYTEAERQMLGEAAEALGPGVLDVYLNDDAYWRCVPERVWGYTLGGYQVMKKWLSYREKALLGRGLRPKEVRAVRDMARRIAGLLLLEGELDGSYQLAVSS